jgi:hypothetical protein
MPLDGAQTAIRSTAFLRSIMNVSRCAVIAALFIAAIVPAPQAVMASPNPISIAQCFVTQPKPMSKVAGGTQIDYTNRGTQNATQVTFAVGYRNAAQSFVRRITDYGTFSPNVEVMHHFQLYNDVTYAGKQVKFCYATMVKWADGSTWVAS